MELEVKTLVTLITGHSIILKRIGDKRFYMSVKTERHEFECISRETYDEFFLSCLTARTTSMS